MSKMKNLAKFSVKQLEEFFASFDIVFCDVDGVIWNYTTSVPGAADSLKALSNLGKKVYLVTNNGTYKIEYFIEKIRRDGYEINSDHIINPIKVIIWYLKKINFHGKVFAIGSEPFLTNLQTEGIQIMEEPKVFPKDTLATIYEVLDRPSVKAVIIDFDCCCNWSKMALAISCLQREDVIYLSAATDIWVGDKNFKILGPGPILNLINNLSEKQPIKCAKPSQIMKDYILDTCNVKNPRRCLFIGDTVEQDMKFASMCGFLKLFVDSGIGNLEDTQKEEDTCPDYYIPSLGHLFSAFKET